jgi:DNA-directed RNA polymerase subunit RPC12/RpoP
MTDTDTEWIVRCPECNEKALVRRSETVCDNCEFHRVR